MAAQLVFCITFNTLQMLLMY